MTPTHDRVSRIILRVPARSQETQVASTTSPPLTDATPPRTTALDDAPPGRRLGDSFGLPPPPAGAPPAGRRHPLTSLLTVLGLAQTGFGALVMVETLYPGSVVGISALSWVAIGICVAGVMSIVERASKGDIDWSRLLRRPRVVWGAE